MKPQQKNLLNFIVNSFLIVSGLLTIVSGFVLQLGFHMGGEGHRQDIGDSPGTSSLEPIREIDPTLSVWGLDYSQWSLLHKVVIVLLSLLMIYHFVIHWKWYKGVISRRLMSKNRQVLILTVLFLLVAVTGLVPWFIDLSGSKSFVRIVLIEIHDKITILLTIYLILHVVKRIRWFFTAYQKLGK